MIATSEDVGLMEAKARRIGAALDKFPEVVGTSFDKRKASVTNSFDFVACRTLLTKRHKIVDVDAVIAYLKTQGVSPFMHSRGKWEYCDWNIYST